MNRLHHLFLLLALLFAALAVQPAVGQSLELPDDSLRADSLSSFEPVSFSYLPIEACGFFLVPSDQSYLFIEDSATFADLVEPKRFIGQCKDLEISQIDFARHSVIGFNLFVDCNAGVGIRVVRDSAARVYKVLVDTYYGGCRGMRSHSYWLLLPALTKGESVVMESHDHERRWGKE